LNEFLIINGKPVAKHTPTGRKKKKSVIGQIGGGKTNLSGIIDVAVMQSLVSGDEVKELVKNYGMVIVDECHHVSAFSFEQILKVVNAKYVYGLTATPTRQDGHHPIITMHCGNIQRWITSSITRNCWVNNNPTYFPVHIKEKLLNIQSDVEEHFCEHCSDMDGLCCPRLIKSISESRGWSAEETERNIFYLVCWESLDEMIENEDEISDHGLFASKMFDDITEANHGNILMELLETIKSREKEILLYRNGFTEKGVLTLEEVGQIYGLTRERIRQLEEKALRRMRHSTRIHRLKD